MNNIDVNKPVENPELRSLLAKLRERIDDDQKLLEVMESIYKNIAMSGLFLAIIHIDDKDIESKADGNTVIKMSSVLRLQMITSPDNQVYLPVFTDWESLQMWDDLKNRHVKTLIVPFDNLPSMINGDTRGVVINPFSDNFRIVKNQLEHMKEMKDLQTRGVAQKVVQEDTPVRLGEPADYPHTMINAICRYAKANKLIKSINMKLMMKGEEKSFLFIVDFNGEKKEIFDGIANAGRPYLPKGMFIDMIPLDSDFGKKAADNQPFYKRKLFGF